MSYHCDHIQVLSAIEGLRRRPVFYLGAKDNPELATRLVCRVVDFAALWAEFCDYERLSVDVSETERLSVRFDGHGLPTERGAFSDGSHPIERWLSEPTQTSQHEIWQVVGVSETFTLTTVRDGHRWTIRFRNGEMVQRLKDEGPTDERGTKIEFKLDREFVTHKPDAPTVFAHISAKNPAFRFDVQKR